MMICEKVFKSTLWLSTAQTHISIESVRNFVITVFVPYWFRYKAHRVASWCNQFLNGTCFEVMIIPTGGVVEELMFGFTPSPECLRRGRKFNEVGQVVTAMESGKSEALSTFAKKDVFEGSEGEEICFAFAWIFGLEET